MSLTVICFGVAAACIIIAIGLGMAAESEGWVLGIPAIIALAGAVVSVIFATGSYNANIRDTTERNKVTCTQEGSEVIRYSGFDYCVKPGSQILRTL